MLYGSVANLTLTLAAWWVTKGGKAFYPNCCNAGTYGVIFQGTDFCLSCHFRAASLWNYQSSNLLEHVWMSLQNLVKLRELAGPTNLQKQCSLHSLTIFQVMLTDWESVTSDVGFAHRITALPWFYVWGWDAAFTNSCEGRLECFPFPPWSSSPCAGARSFNWYPWVQLWQQQEQMWDLSPNLNSACVAGQPCSWRLSPSLLNEGILGFFDSF